MEQNSKNFARFRVLLVVLGGRQPPGRDTGMGKRAEGFYSQFFIFTVPTLSALFPFFFLLLCQIMLFIETEFTYGTIRPFKVYKAVGFSIFAD